MRLLQSHKPKPLLRNDLLDKYCICFLCLYLFCHREGAKRPWRSQSLSFFPVIANVRSKSKPRAEGVAGSNPDLLLRLSFLSLRTK